MPGGNLWAFLFLTCKVFLVLGTSRAAGSHVACAAMRSWYSFLCWSGQEFQPGVSILNFFDQVNAEFSMFSPPFHVSCESCATFSRHNDAEQPCSRPEQRDSRSCLQVKESSGRTIQKTTPCVTSAGPSRTLLPHIEESTTDSIRRPSTLRFSSGCNRTI